MFSTLVWLRLHPVVVIIGYGISWGWFDWFFTSLAVENWMPLPNQRIMDREPTAWHDPNVTVEWNASFVRRLQDNPTFVAGRWHDANPSDWSTRFVCQLKVGMATCPRPIDFSVGAKACAALKDAKAEWTYREIDERCYVVPYPHTNWNEAQLCCKSVGAQLVSIKDASTNEFVTKLCAARFQETKTEDYGDRPNLLEISRHLCWIGLSKDVGMKRWVWEDGSVLGESGSEYQNWDGGDEGVLDKENANNENTVFLIPVDSKWDDARWGWIWVFVIIVILVAVVYCIYGFLYKQRVTDKRPPIPAVEGGELDPSLVIVHDFKHGLCDTWCVSSDPDMCFDVYYCLPIRVADTHSSAGTGKSFWLIFTVFEVAFVIEYFINAFENAIGWELNQGWIFGGIVRCMLMANLRQKLRQKFGGPEGNCCADCLTWWCCSFCAACQEGRQVDEAHRLKVKCCCKITPWQPAVQTIGQTQMVGHAIGTAPSDQGGMVTVIGQPVQGQPVPNSTEPTKVTQGTVA